MIEVNTWTLPGGFALPVTVETVTLLEYTTEPQPLAPARAEALLQEESLRQTRASMVAGRVERGSATVFKSRDSYHCRGIWNCVELISRTADAELFREDEANGETDQRGAN